MSEPRLWIVPVEYTISFDMAVIATTAEQAGRVARQHASEERDNVIDDEEVWVSSPREVTKLDEVDDELRDAAPWGEVDDDFAGTVADWFEQFGPPPPTEREMKAAGQLNLLASA